MIPAGHVFLTKAGVRSSQRFMQGSRRDSWNQEKPMVWGADRVRGRIFPLKPRCSAPQMGAIGKLSDDMRRHFRMKLRNLFTKFIRKFGSVP